MKERGAGLHSIAETVAGHDVKEQIEKGSYGFLGFIGFLFILFPMVCGVGTIMSKELGIPGGLKPGGGGGHGGGGHGH